MIKICQPELEALIYKRQREGAFASVEDVLMQALRNAPLPVDLRSQGPTGEEIIAAFQRSPHKEIDLEPERIPILASDPVQF